MILVVERDLFRFPHTSKKGHQICKGASILIFCSNNRSGEWSDMIRGVFLPAKSCTNDHPLMRELVVLKDWRGILTIEVDETMCRGLWWVDASLETETKGVKGMNWGYSYVKIVVVFIGELAWAASLPCVTWASQLAPIYFTRQSPPKLWAKGTLPNKGGRHISQSRVIPRFPGRHLQYINCITKIFLFCR